MSNHSRWKLPQTHAKAATGSGIVQPMILNSSYGLTKSRRGQHRAANKWEPGKRSGFIVLVSTKNRNKYCTSICNVRYVWFPTEHNKYACVWMQIRWAPVLAVNGLWISNTYVTFSYSDKMIFESFSNRNDTAMYREWSWKFARGFSWE